MVNRFSASAAEIAAAALQDYGRALIVGDISTHGKGTVQSLNPLKPFMVQQHQRSRRIEDHHPQILPRSAALPPSSKASMPDIVLPDVLNYSTQIGETNLDNPLPWDTIQPASYEKFNLVQPYLAQLHERSDARVATNQDFVYVRQDIEQYQEIAVGGNGHAQRTRSNQGAGAGSGQRPRTGRSCEKSARTRA